MPLVMWISTMKLPGGPVILGGAKPVPVNPANYTHPRRGDIIVSLAGVAANLVIALLCTVGIAVFGLLSDVAPATSGTVGFLQAMMVTGIRINIALIAFNLIPIPPLDGSHVMKYLLPPALSLRYQQMTRYGLIVLVALLYFGGGLLNLWMRPAVFVMVALFTSVSRFIDPSAERWLQ